MPGRKGASLTTYLSFASRYLVLMPGSKGGVSRKIEDEEERARLKDIVAQLKIPDDIGCIVRTAAEKQSKRELSRDLSRLLRMWRKIKEEVPTAPALSLIHKEQDIGLRTLRDYFTSEISEVLVDDKDTFAVVRDYMKIISPRHQRRVKLYKEKEPLFSHYQIEQQIETVYSATVPLKSGGSIVIDSTEALVAVDVNSGRGRGKNVENVAFKANMEAAVEIARQSAAEGHGRTHRHRLHRYEGPKVHTECGKGVSRRNKDGPGEDRYVRHIQVRTHGAFEAATQSVH